MTDNEHMHHDDVAYIVWEGQIFCGCHFIPKIEEGSESGGTVSPAVFLDNTFLFEGESETGANLFRFDESGFLHFVVHRGGKLRIEIYMEERKHRHTPHFHATFKGKKGSYSIETGEPISKNQRPTGMDRAVKDYWQADKHVLAHVWNKTRSKDVKYKCIPIAQSITNQVINGKEKDRIAGILKQHGSGR